MDRKKLFYILNAILIALILAGDICYIVLGGLLFKALTSALFVLLGGANVVYLILQKEKDKRFPIIMLVGLFFAMLGDIVLNLHFIAGAILFAVGHVFYFVSYCFLAKFKPTDLIAGVCIFVPSCLLITLAPFFDFGGVMMEIICVVYALIISLMVGKAISNLIREKTLLNLLIVIGSCLFFFSDLMLLLNVFGNLPRVVDILCLATYYPAECFLAHSLLHFKGERKEISQSEK